MINILDIDNVKIIGKNERVAMGRGRIRTSTKYKSFVNLLMLNFKYLNNIYEKREITKVKIYLKMYHDIDAPISAILDAMQSAGIIENDRQIRCLEVEKIPIKKGKRGAIEVYISEWEYCK